MLALAIIALIAGLALPRVRAFDGASSVRAAAYSAAALLRADRDAALGQNRTVETAVELDRRRLRSGARGETVTLPQGVPLRFVSAAGPLKFYPEGRSSGGALLIGAGAAGLRLEIDPLTAAIRIRPADAP